VGTTDGAKTAGGRIRPTAGTTRVTPCWIVGDATCTTATSGGELARGFDGCPCEPTMLDGLADERGVTTTSLGARTDDGSWALRRWETAGASWWTPTRVMLATVPALIKARIAVATPVVLPVSLARREPAILPMSTCSPIALPGTPAVLGLTTVFRRDAIPERPKG
jgi:hypothetical protein